MKPEHPTPIEVTVTPDLMGAEMLRLLADAIEDEFNSERNEMGVLDPEPVPAFKLRRSTFRILGPTRS